jgi:hypothetical protein
MTNFISHSYCRRVPCAEQKNFVGLKIFHLKYLFHHKLFLIPALLLTLLFETDAHFETECSEVDTWHLNINMHFFVVFWIKEQTICVVNYNKNNKGQEYLQQLQ